MTGRTWQNSMACAALAVAGMTTGCAAALPQQKLAASQSAIRGAEEVGARTQPLAALHLKLARDEQERAKALCEQGDELRCSLMLARSRVDGELAIALTREAKARAEAERVRNEIQVLEQQTQPTR